MFRYMARTRPEGRLDDIASAAMDSFGRLGYRRTKMAEVSAAAGLSAGAVYTYVDSKEALFHVALAVGFDEPVPSVLPIIAPGFDQTLDVIRNGLRRLGTTELLKQAVGSDPPAEVRKELAAIVDEQYSVISRLRRVLSVIEACASDLPALEDFYFGRRRRGQIGLLVRYLERRAAEGYVTDLSDLSVAAQLVHESVAWFAWKRFEGRDAARFDDEAARRTVIEFCCNALLEPGGRSQ